MNQVHRHATELLDVPPVLLVTEYEPVRIRQELAAYLDGRRVNDALSQAVMAIRNEYELGPHAYVVVFPEEGLEIPIDLREISDDSSRLAGFVKEPRGTTEVIFEYTELRGTIADQLTSVSREEAITGLKELSSDGQEFLLSDSCCDDERFAHQFSDGRYHHNYRYIAARLSR